ncbi:hypothetical protein ID866_3589 [Astraeus odoratus]|nr:hypothetical protein ID866_3589 [Astraeus odoratus]
MTPALPSPSSLSRASSTATTTTTSAPATAPPADRVYKGKYTNRSWQQLPPELVRTIATYHLLNVQLSNYCPLTWDAKELWHSRLVYTTLRDALDLERLMHVTPAWAAALETHLFWTKACALLDPHDVLAHHAIVRPPLAAVPPPSAPGPGGAAVSPQQQQQQQSQQPYRLTPYRHFRQMTARSCYVCRINSPYASTGLSSAKRIYHTTTLGPIILCKDHRKTMFCGLCLREAPPAECDPPLDIHGNTLRFSGYQQQAYGLDRHLAMSLGGVMPPTHTMAFNPALMVCCAENEDEETWPGVDTTCRSCRNEHLWQRISSSMRDREAVGGPRFVPPGYSPSSIRSSKKNRSMLMSRYPPAKYASADWETRQTVDAFIDLGEGSIAEVINVAREKFWLRSQTKMPELMEQAVAATRWNGENMEVMTPTVTPATAVAPTHRALSSSTDAVVDDTTAAETQRPSPPPRPTQQQHRPRLRSRSPSPRSAISSPYDDQGSCGEVSEEEVSEEEEEEDPEFLSLTEDAGGIKELAISDWARSRILDGHWCSPADQWYGHSWPAGGGVRDAGEETESEPDEEEEMRDGRAGVGLVKRVVRVPAVHPCPWTLPAQPPSLSPGDMDDIHPRLSTVRAHVPPSFNLCEQAFRAYQKQFQLILFPAMSNLVRRFVIEASTLKCNSGTYNTSNHLMDPAVRVAKMDYEEVLEGLREPGVWFEGFDWVGAMSTHSGSSDGSDHLRYQHHHHRDREEDASSSTSSDSRGSSDVSHTTSPVLSTTTLQTTPSPPPAHDDKIRRNTSNSHNKDKLSSPSSTTAATATPFVSPIPVSPTLEHPKLIHPIPYVPITLTHMAQYSLDTFKMVGDGVVIVAPADIDAATRNGDECATQESAVASSGNLGLTTTTGTPRQRKRSSEELELNGTTRLSSEVPSSTNDLDKRIGSIKQKRLRVEPSPPSGGEDPYLHLPNKRKICAASMTPRSLSASPPSSVTVVSSTGSSSSEEDKARTKRTSGASAFVDVSVRDPIREKTGLVQGGELDGLYVFEEV